ncbi:hypothetical protein RIF29_21575 [Crotalaria pallida]|uniref:Uncharacterized protein n=1 Tax=Crotalaria pallida TaxID=3830 RepID=A0AAN9F4T6_CROPI
MDIKIVQLQPLSQQHSLVPRARTSPFVYANRGMTAQPVRPRQFQNIAAAMAQQEMEMEMEVSSEDGTRPYINLLDKPIPNNGIMPEGNPDLQNLDLTLRL